MNWGELATDTIQWQTFAMTAMKVELAAEQLCAQERLLIMEVFWSSCFNPSPRVF